MANLILPSRRIAQPQDAAPIDWSNPLSAGLVFDVDGTSTLEKVSGVFGSSVGSTKSVDESIGHKFVRASSQYINYGDLSSFDFGTSNFSYECLLKLNSSASGSARMQLLSKDSASGRQLWFEFNTVANGTSDNSASLVWLNGGSLSQTRSPIDSTPAGTLLHIVAQKNGSGVEYYINGQLVTTTVINASLPAIVATTTAVYLGARAYSGNNDHLDGNIYIARLRNRALSAREVLELYANPWQVYEKQNRVLYFDLNASGGLNLSQTSRFDNSNSFYAHTVITGAVTLITDLFSNSNIFYTHTVTQGGVTQTLGQNSSFQNSNSFYASTVTPGSINLTVSLFSNSNTFYGHIVSSGGLVLHQDSRLDNVNSFYVINVTLSAVNLTANLFYNSNTLFNPTINQAALLDLTQSERFDNTSNFYVAAIGSGTTLTPADIAAIIAAMRIEFATELARIDVAISTRLAATYYTAPDNTGIAALPTAAENAATLIAAAKITPIHSDLRKAIGVEYHGDGSENNKLRSTLVP